MLSNHVGAVGARRAVPRDGIAWAAFSAIVMLAFVVFGLSISNISEAFIYMGIDHEPLLGTSRAVRSDEWIVFLPSMKMVVNAGFAQPFDVSLYDVSQVHTFSMPFKDWSIVFKPQFWGFFLFDADRGLSFYTIFLPVAFVWANALFLKSLRPFRRTGFTLCVLAALVLYFAHSNVVWWTSNAPVFAFAVLPILAYHYIDNLVASVAVGFYAMMVLLFSYVYPPFFISFCLAYVIIYLFFGMEELEWKRLTLFAGAGVLALALWFSYYSGYFEAIFDTSHPGKRISVSRKMEVNKMLSHLVPYMNIQENYDPVRPHSNAAEIAVFATFFVIVSLIFGRWENVLRSVTDNTAYRIIAVASALVATMWVTVNGVWLPLLDRSPPQRFVLGWGLMLSVVSLIAIVTRDSRDLPYKQEGMRVIVALSLLAVIYHFHPHRGGLILAAGIIAIYVVNLVSGRFRHGFVVATVLSVQALVFGGFNPITKTDGFFGEWESNKITEIRNNPVTFAGETAYYAYRFHGNLLPSLGMPSINETQLSPNVDFWDEHLPCVDDGDLDAIFNRYAHIIPIPEGDIKADGNLIELPISRTGEVSCSIPPKSEE